MNIQASETFSSEVLDVPRLQIYLTNKASLTTPPFIEVIYAKVESEPSCVWIIDFPSFFPVIINGEKTIKRTGMS
jgi:hypothetical protein